MSLKPAVERGLLALVNVAESDHDLGLDQFGSSVLDEIDLGPHEAVDLVRGAVAPGEDVDLTAAIEALTLGIGLPDADGGPLDRSLAELAGDLLGRVGADASRGGDAVGILRDLAESGDVGSAVEDLGGVFGPLLTRHTNPAFPDRVRLTGPGARVAAQLLDLTVQRGTECHATFVDDPVSGWPVTVVRLEACTSLPFDECRARIDPLQWTRCNPYFASVTPTGPRVDDPTGWCGGIKEVVGPGLNFRYYETDLSVRYYQQPDHAFCAFDLSSDRHDDKHVVVDRGCLGVIDEGPHRRVQMAKVYRIDDFDAPHGWVCPLWASQFVIAGWSCSMTVPMRRLLRAWSNVQRTAVDFARAWHDVAHGCCEPEAPSRSKVGPLQREYYEVPLAMHCAASWDPGHPGAATVAVPATTASKSFSPLTAEQLIPGQTPTKSRPVQVGRSVSGAVRAVQVGLAPGVTGAAPDPGLYVGRLRDDHGLVNAPYSVYVTGVPGT